MAKTTFGWLNHIQQLQPRRIPLLPSLTETVKQSHFDKNKHQYTRSKAAAACIINIKSRTHLNSKKNSHGHGLRPTLPVSQHQTNPSRQTPALSPKDDPKQCTHPVHPHASTPPGAHHPLRQTPKAPSRPYPPWRGDSSVSAPLAATPQALSRTAPWQEPLPPKQLGRPPVRPRPRL